MEGLGLGSLEVWESEKWVATKLLAHDMELRTIDAGRLSIGGENAGRSLLPEAYRSADREKPSAASSRSRLANGKPEQNWRVMGGGQGGDRGCADTFIGLDDALVEKLKAMAEKPRLFCLSFQQGKFPGNRGRPYINPKNYGRRQRREV